ncbi:MAG: zinc ABC transporter substrate-binding protein [Clostridiales bacterium]|jgi:zinc transport system substrate-binding protein|nr:zinc ABC transporter substrate-binding protein [Clostridiales bacterium]
MIRTVLSFALVILLLFSACTAGRSAPADTSRLRVATSFYPVWLLTRAVVGDTEGVRVTNMAPAAAGCLHDYALTMNDLKLLEDADVLILCGGGMESFAEQLAASQPNLKLAEASENLTQLPSVTGETEYNAHLWMSTDGACGMAANIAHTLGELDPAYADVYEKNAVEFSGKLRALRDETAARLKDIPVRDIVIFHESFAYVAADYDLNVVGVIAKEPNEEPTAQELNTVIAAVKKYGVTALFADAQYDDRAAQTIALETGAKIVTVHSLVSPGENDLADFLTLTKANCDVLVRALGGKD